MANEDSSCPLTNGDGRPVINGESNNAHGQKRKREDPSGTAQDSSRKNKRRKTMKTSDIDMEARINRLFAIQRTLVRQRYEYQYKYDILQFRPIVSPSIYSPTKDPIK